MMQIVSVNVDKIGEKDWDDPLDYYGSVSWVMFNMFRCAVPKDCGLEQMDVIMQTLDSDESGDLDLEG